MTKVFLAASVAALAIAAPSAAAPGGHGGGDKAARQHTDRASARVDRQAARADRQSVRAERQTVRPARQARIENRQAMRADRPARVENRQAMRAERPARMANRQAMHAERPARVESRQVARQAMRADRQAMRVDRAAQVQGRIAARDQMKVDRQIAVKDRIAVRQDLRASRLAALNPRNGGTILAPAVAAKFVGQPLTQVSTIAALAPLPQSVQYLYPDTNDYYYRYGDGYVYQVDRGSNLISMLLPLLTGGYMPGQYLPSNYMNSYVPSAYSAFYPNTQNQCTRYANGVIYYVDCYTGLVENVMPLYDNGYGVGQMLPSSYGYYNVPSQYRDMYYNSADTGYWYAPGAIYQYDQKTSLITSIAALLTPGMSIGQPLPAGYSAYNVPMGFRDTYYDTPDNMYRYSNGNIYQVNPATLLVTALVASALT